MILHLGNGASACAIDLGHSTETSMGLTPLEGLVMGTRAGDIDPGALLMLLRGGFSVDELDALLSKKSGLAGLSGAGNDLRDIERRAAEGDDRCRLAITVYTHRVRKYVGAYAAAMGGLDAVVLTAGIGENSVSMRQRILHRFDFMGLAFDEDRNAAARVSHDKPVAEISGATSRVRALVVKTNEELSIGRQTAEAVTRWRLSGQGGGRRGARVPRGELWLPRWARSGPSASAGDLCHSAPIARETLHPTARRASRAARREGESSLPGPAAHAR